VWRYDRPQAGRYREFYQADCDILGSYALDCEVELLLMATEVLASFGLSEYKLVINNRKILDAQVRASGIPPEKKPDALRALDKLLKVGKDGMKEEFLRYGLSDAQFDAFYGTIVVDTLDEAAHKIRGDEIGESGVRELRDIFDKAARLGFAEHLHFDWTLVRGLDYYTGPIFEAQAKTESGFGSFGGGGRYDDLVGLYGGQPQGAVGLSFGAERLIGLLEERGLGQEGGTRAVLVAPLGGEVEAAQQLALTLRRGGVAARVVPGFKDRGAAFKYSTATGLDRVILVGPEEASGGVFGLRQAGGTEQRGTAEELVKILSEK
jgi:histidyl-tRNA synthetase